MEGATPGRRAGSSAAAPLPARGVGAGTDEPTRTTKAGQAMQGGTTGGPAAGMATAGRGACVELLARAGAQRAAAAEGIVQRAEGLRLTGTLSAGVEDAWLNGGPTGTQAER
eukprot:688349-Pleurochrysis_carterae.AAC.1